MHTPIVDDHRRVRPSAHDAHVAPDRGQTHERREEPEGGEHDADDAGGRTAAAAARDHPEAACQEGEGDEQGHGADEDLPGGASAIVMDLEDRFGHHGGTDAGSGDVVPGPRVDEPPRKARKVPVAGQRGRAAEARRLR